MADCEFDRRRPRAEVPCPETDLLAYYAAYYRDGVIDLSSSSPPPEPLPGDGRGREALCYVPPTGGSELRERIANLYDSLSADDIILSAGASEALVALVHALVGPGEMVAAERGVYSSLIEAAHRIGAEVVSERKARWAALTALCNPTVPAGKLHRAWPDVLANQPVVVDECHLDVVFGDQNVGRAADYAPNFVSVSGLSKSLGFGGLRIGWIATHSPGIRERVDRQLQLLSGGPASLSVDAALRAFCVYEARTREIRCDAEDNATRIQQVLHEFGWSYEAPEAGLTLEARPPAPVSRSAERRLRSMNYFLVPCSVYGSPGSYRLSLLAPVQHVRTALAVLATCGRKTACL